MTTPIPGRRPDTRRVSPAQQAAAIQRRRDIWEALHGSADSADPSTDALGRRRTPQQRKTFAADTKDKTGEDDRRTREHLARAEALGPDLHAVIGTSSVTSADIAEWRVDKLPSFLSSNNLKPLFPVILRGRQLPPTVEIRTATGHKKARLESSSRIPRAAYPAPDESGRSQAEITLDFFWISDPGEVRKSCSTAVASCLHLTARRPA